MTLKVYFEKSTVGIDPNTGLVNVIARHLQKRQHLGSAIVVCDKPIILMAVLRKQWLKITRGLQRERASTINAEKILRVTQSIARMQQMNFAAKTPEFQPNADVFFLTPDDLDHLPPDCMTVYVTSGSPEQVKAICDRLPDRALVVDHTKSLSAEVLGIRPRSELNKAVEIEWQKVIIFLKNYDISIKQLCDPLQHVALEEALDTLLSHGNKFLHVAADFHLALEHAEPLEIDYTLRQQYDMFGLLSHRVQALSTKPFDRYLEQVFKDSAAFFLRDSASEEELELAQLNCAAYVL